ncbi:MAG: hypothetical protein IIA07_04750 [Proteobacteria bacterium]|nr:hypothetical protein [Pseudomonadota bacterium]
MKHDRADDVAVNLQRSTQGQMQGRLADLSNLPKPRWRDVLVALASPATRLHRYRNLRAAMFDDATRNLDCRDRR